jgi:hypothetical protein
LVTLGADVLRQYPPKCFIKANNLGPKALNLFKHQAAGLKD